MSERLLIFGYVNCRSNNQHFREMVKGGILQCSFKAWRFNQTCTLQMHPVFRWSEGEGGLGLLLTNIKLIRGWIVGKPITREPWQGANLCCGSVEMSGSTQYEDKGGVQEREGVVERNPFSLAFLPYSISFENEAFGNTQIYAKIFKWSCPEIIVRVKPLILNFGLMSML